MEVLSSSTAVTISSSISSTISSIATSGITRSSFFSATYGTDVVLDIPLFQRVVEAVILAIISLVALIGNVSLWIVICSDRVLRTTSNALILSLSAADLLVSGITMPVVTTSILRGRWFSTHEACVLMGFLAMTTFISSVMSLGVISLNRFLLICYPVHFKLVYTPRHTAFIIAGTWMVSMLLAMPPLVGWGMYDYLPGQSFCFCNWKSSISYTIFMVLVCFGGPCVVMAISYVGILRKVRDSRRRVNASSSDKSKKTSTQPKPKPKLKAKVQRHLRITVFSKRTSSGNDANNTAAANDNQDAVGCATKPSISGVENDIGIGGDNSKPATNTQATTTSSGKATTKATVTDKPTATATSKPRTVRRGQQEDIRLTVTLLVVILVFVVSWLPFCITMFLSAFSPYPVPRIPNILTLLLGCLNSSCNPIIYGIMNKRFWDGYKKIYCCFCRKRGIFVSESDNTAAQSCHDSTQ